MAFVTRIILAVCIVASYANATITLSSTSRGGTSATGAGSPISGRAPLPIVLDVGSGTTTTHSTGSAEQIGIRFAEKKLTTCSYTHATLTLTCTDAFTALSWELNTASTNGGTDWTASTGDLLAYYHDGGTEVHGKPIGVRIAGSDAVEGTCGSLTDGQWCWGDSDTIGSNRVYVQLTAPATDPDLEATGHVKVIYGDGEYIELQHADFNSGNPVFVYVDTKVSDDAITLATAPTGASADETNVTVFQAVNPWTDLRYNYSVSCTGGTCVEDISNGDQRPGLTTTAIDETVGRGPIWAFVFAEGFTTATITITVNDDANGDTEDSQTIDVGETAWTSSTDYYISAAGNDATGDGSIGNPWLTWTKLITSLAAVSNGTTRRGFLNRGDSFTLTGSSTWGAEPDDTLISPYGTGADPIVTVGSGQQALTGNSSTAQGLRIVDINFQRSAGGTDSTITSVGTNHLFLRCVIEGQGTNPALERGTGFNTTDGIVWDCHLEHITGGASGDYAHYTGGNGARLAMMGCYATNAGNTLTVRLYDERGIVAYNQMVHAGTNTGDAVVELGSGNAADYRYMYANYVDFGAVAGDGVLVLIDDLSEEHTFNYLIDSNFFSGAASGATTVGIRIVQDNTPTVSGDLYNLVAKNNVFQGLARAVQNNSRRIVGTRVFSNSVNTTRGSGTHLVNDSGGTFENLKVINNAVRSTNSSANSRVVDNSGTYGKLALTQITNNIWTMGASAVLATVESLAYTNESDWTAASGKAAQAGVESNPLFALPTSNDFRLCTASGVPDASCSGASPCIDAGYDLPTVYYDYSGAVRNSDDVGAWDDDSAGMEMGAGPPVGSFMLMGVGR